MAKPRVPVGLLGGTGLVGKQYRKLLSAHPFFELVFAPEREAIEKSLPLVIDQLARRCRLIFSALPTAVAKRCEGKIAERGLFVFSVAAHHRLSVDVPLLVPEINPDHLEILSLQQQLRGWGKGGVIAKPNCTLQSYLLPLFPLHTAFEVTKVVVTNLQAISGAGKGFDLKGNVIPFIEGEEEKSELEPLKILGKVTSRGIEPARGIAISAHCNRVPIPFGHLSCVSVAFKRCPTREEVLDAWHGFSALPQRLALPSAPARPLTYLDACDRPQPKLDCDHSEGMGVVVGRLRCCPVLDYRFISLSHNLVRGAAGGALLGAELAYERGIL